jgi:hypothetical protein
LFGSSIHQEKSVVLIPILVGITNVYIQYFTFAYNGATGTSVSLTAIPAISWWSIAYLVVWFCTYFLLPLFMRKIFRRN